MTLWRFEVRKMFKMNRGGLIAALFIIAELALLILGDTPVDAGAALFREEYLAALSEVEGPWTPEKAALLESRARDAEGLSEGFDVLYKQYLYVNEGREDRYFLDANGWAGLLADRGPDIPLAAAIILLSVPVYCGEAGGMKPLALTSCEGKRLFCRHKLLLALAAASGLSLSADLVRLVFFALKYGLPHGRFPVQSVELFGSSGKGLSLLGAEALAAGLRLLGAVELCMLTLLAAAVCGQFALSAFLATAAVLLPWIGLERQARYSLPLPSSLLAAVGFIRGSEFETDAMTGESAALFREVSTGELALIAAGAALICAMCVLMIRARYTTALSRRPGAGRRAAALCLALALGLALDGCAEKAMPTAGGTVYNSRDERLHEYNGLTVSVRDSEIVVTDASGVTSPLVRDALKGVNGELCRANFFASGRYVYYWREDSEGGGRDLASHTGRTYITSLVRADLDTFTQDVVFEEVIQYTLLGIDLPAGGALNSPGDGDFFVDENYIYILGPETCRVELSTGRPDVLRIPSNHNVAFDGRSIYYIDPEGVLSAFDTKTGETSALYSGPVSDFRLTEEGLSITTRTGTTVNLPLRAEDAGGQAGKM